MMKFSSHEYLVFGAIGVVGILGAFVLYKMLSPRFSQPVARDKLANIMVGTASLQVELARTPTEIQQGLSDRQEIGADGMLFLLPQRAPQTFWMLRMHFPLDMVWLDQGKIVQIDADVPPPSETEGIPTVVPAKQAVEAVLEVPAGTAARQGWTVGTPWQIRP